MTSLGVHGILLALACWIVLASPIAVKTHQDPDLFVTASGSSKPASTTQAYTIKNTPRKLQGSTRIFVNNNNASIALPELTGVSDMMSANFSMEKGMGREGFGQGRGISFGSGLGDSRSLVGKFVMGAAIKAQRVAVYLDCSGSMRPYLEKVTAEIKKEYPDADVFRFDGARVVSLENNKGAPTLIYSDSNYHKVGRIMPVKPWQAKWMEAFKKGAVGQGPKLYLFSLQQPPQGLLKACVEASGGASLSVGWLKSGRPPN